VSDKGIAKPTGQGGLSVVFGISGGVSSAQRDRARTLATITAAERAAALNTTQPGCCPPRLYRWRHRTCTQGLKSEQLVDTARKCSAHKDDFRSV
jgi:hypothetical protein